MIAFDTRVARYTWTAALVLLGLVAVYLMRHTLFLFVVAVLFAYLLAPLVNVIDRLIPGDRTRTWALAIAYVIFVGLLFLAVTQLGSRAIEQANSLAKSMPGVLDKLRQPAPTIPPGANTLKARVVQEVQRQLARGSGNFFSYLPNLGAEILKIASNLIYVVIVPILAFFFLKDGRKLPQDFLEMIDDARQRSLLDDLMADVNLLLAHYMRALLMLCLATFTSYSIVLSIMGAPFGILLAVLAGLLEIVPIIGPLTAGILIVVVTAVSSGPVVGTLIFLLLYRMFQDYVLSPLLMQHGIELHPLLVLFGVFAGAEIAGVAGAFLSVPILALIRIVYRRVRRRRIAVISTPPPVAPVTLT